MPVGKTFIPWIASSKIFSVVLVLLWGGTLQSFSDARGCTLGYPARRVSFVNPTCKLGPILLRGGYMSDEEEDALDEEHHDDPLGNEIIHSFHDELQRIRSEMVAEAIHEMDLLRDELIRKKQERRHRRVSSRQSSDGSNSEFEGSGTIKYASTEPNDDEDQLIMNDLQSSDNIGHDVSSSNDNEVLASEKCLEQVGEYDEVEDFEESQHELCEEKDEIVEEVKDSEEVVMDGTDEYDSDAAKKLGNKIEAEIEIETESHNSEEDQQFEEELDNMSLENEVLQDDSDEEHTNDVKCPEKTQKDEENILLETKSEKVIHNVDKVSTADDVTKDISPDFERESVGITSDNQAEESRSERKKKKKKKKKKEKKIEKEQKKEKKKRKKRKKSAEQTSTASICQPTTTFKELEKPSFSNKVQSSSMKKELVKVLLFVVAFILSQLTMGFILRLLKSTDK